jgi:hypothetical protein
MKPGIRSIIAKVAICALIVTTSTVPALATRPRPENSIPTQGQADWIAVAVIAIGAAAALAIYFAVRPHHRSLTGCAVSGPTGLQLQSQGDQQPWALAGELAAIKPGERVRVSGKKQKNSAGAPQQFLVEKLAKDYGSCTPAPVAP